MFYPRTKSTVFVLVLCIMNISLFLYFVLCIFPLPSMSYYVWFVVPEFCIRMFCCSGISHYVYFLYSVCHIMYSSLSMILYHECFVVPYFVLCRSYTSLSWCFVCFVILILRIMYASLSRYYVLCMIHYPGIS